MAAATLAGLPLRHRIEPTNLVMLYLAAVLIAALNLGRGPALVASILSTMAFDFFMVPPHLTFAVYDAQYLLTFAGLLVVSLVISSLAARAREQAEAAQRRHTQAVGLYELGRDLAAAGDLPTILQSVLRHVQRSFDAPAVVLLADDPGVTVAGITPGLELDSNELAVATWAQSNARPAGLGTDTLPEAALRYLPLQTGERTVGVLGLRLPQKAGHLFPDEKRLLEATANLAAIAIERIALAEKAEQVELLKATENLQSALLNSLSHELRTPLATITGVLSSLQQQGRGETQAPFERDTLLELVDTALQESQRLNHLVGNLLDMTRLQAGALQIHREPTDIQDLIGAVLGQLGQRLDERPLEVELAADLPLVPLDFVLVAQVLVNLLDNAVKYSAAGTPLAITARTAGDDLEVQVMDRGPGIPAEDLDLIFDKFHRVQRPDSAAGTGLGLAISRGIIEAHGGTIHAANRSEGGAAISFRLPLRVPTDNRDV